MKNIKLNILLNPLIIYSLIWILTALLISLKITKNLEEFSGDGALLVYITISTAIIFLLWQKYFFKKNIPEQKIDIFRLQKITNKIFYIWIFLIILYSILAGGFGLLWILRGIQVDYTDVQIPSLWGLNITLCYSLGCAYLYLLMNSNEKRKNLLKLRFFVLIPIF